MLTDSTRRALRTAFQVLTAVLLAIPAVALDMPNWEVAAQIVVVAGIISKAINTLEEIGLLPAWLKGPVPVGVPTEDGTEGDALG